MLGYTITKWRITVTARHKPYHNITSHSYENDYEQATVNTNKGLRLVETALVYKMYEKGSKFCIVYGRCKAEKLISYIACQHPFSDVLVENPQLIYD